MISIIKLLLRSVLRVLYGVRVTGLEHYRDAGNRVLIVANHTSLLDGVLLYAWLPETPTFAINTEIASRRGFRFFLKFVDLFTMDPTSPLSVKSMIRFIERDRKAVIFPEGRITVTGILMKIYEGPGLVADKTGAAVLPVSIEGAQRSPFSYMHGVCPVSRFPRIRMTILPARRLQIDAALRGHARRKAAARAMRNIMLELMFHTFDHRRDIFGALVESARINGMNRTIIEDINREPLSYRQLLTRSMILARAMSPDTVVGEHVGLLLPNTNATVITFLGLQYLQRVPAMLNYTAGAQGLLAACETAQIRTVYTSRRFIDAGGLGALAGTLEANLNVVYLEDLRARVGVVDRVAGVLRGRFVVSHYRRLHPRPDPDLPAVILFTSGSEGIPKGVVLSHANLLSNYAQVRCHIDFNLRDLMFSCMPMFHSFGLNAGCIMPLLGGSRVFLYPTPLHYRIIPELIYELGATILFGTNTFFKGYARYADEFDMRTLRYAVAGAERLRDDTVHTWFEKFGVRILQGYGVTEASPVVAVNTPQANRTGAVGQLLPGMSCRLVPVDGISQGGRLCIRGPNVMLGYLLHGKEGQLQPFDTVQGDGWYDTGDIAELDADGFLTIVGRAKRFAKLGGEMISLTAVEELAGQTWPRHHHAAVSLSDEKKGEKVVLITDCRNATRRDIQERARQLGYAELYVPRRVVLAEEIPVLGTGKTDYVTLTQMAEAEDREGSGWIRRIAELVG